MTKELYAHYLKHPIVCTDTREIKPNALFFSLKGGNFNGNQFAEKALNEGCSIAIIDEEKYKVDDRYFLVDDVLKTLQELANYHRKQLSIPIIGITGTNGKTTSKELLHAVLSQKYNVLATKGNLNNHIGVPLTLLNITGKHEIAIIEMGANHMGEIAMLAQIAEPNFGMITNIGKAHLEGFGGYENVIKTKNELFQFIQKNKGTLFVNNDNELLRDLSKNIESVTFGSAGNIDFIGELVDCNPFVKLKCKATSDQQPLDEKPIISTQLIGNYNFENLLAAAAIGNYFNVSEAQIINGLEAYVPSNNRSQVIQKDSNLLLLDAYNANPSSMHAAIENFSQMQQNKKTVILGDMLELGDDSAKEHQAIIDLLAEKNIEHILLVGKYFKACTTGGQTSSFDTTDQLLSYLQEKPITNSSVLIKGSRGIQLEKTVEVL